MVRDRLTTYPNILPSLMRGSAQLTWITKVKPDPDDPTVGISILIVKSLNADFDGKRFAITKLV